MTLPPPDPRLEPYLFTASTVDFILGRAADARSLLLLGCPSVAARLDAAGDMRTRLLLDLDERHASLTGFRRVDFHALAPAEEGEIESRSQKNLDAGGSPLHPTGADGPSPPCTSGFQRPSAFGGRGGGQSPPPGSPDYFDINNYHMIIFDPPALRFPPERVAALLARLVTPARRLLLAYPDAMAPRIAGCLAPRRLVRLDRRPEYETANPFNAAFSFLEAE